MHYLSLLMAQQIMHIHLIPVSLLVFTHTNTDVTLALPGLPTPSFSFHLIWKKKSFVFFGWTGFTLPAVFWYKALSEG